MTAWSRDTKHRRRLAGCVPICVPILGALLLAGCTKSEPAEFRLNMVTLASFNLGEEPQQAIANVLQAMYGTPDHPFVLPESGLDLAKLKRAAGPVKSEEPNAPAGLYRKHCAHCHGITGDGQGPTARFLNPYPRDYRQGIFKFKSTNAASKPTHADLLRILDNGVPGTAMPSFLLLTPSEKDDLIEYVIYLSLRGQTEISLAGAIGDMTEQTLEAIEKEVIQPAVLVQGTLTELAGTWQNAEEEVVRPDPATAPADDHRTTAEIAASVDQGRDLFFGERAACAKCHGRTALGDGQTNDYDAWNKQIVEFAKTIAPEPVKEDPPPGASAEEIEALEERYQAAVELYNSAGEQLKRESYAAALPPRNIRPRNLRAGVYRGGRRPLDIYRRIAVGIEGVPMPGVGKKTPDAKVGLAPEEVWTLVDYVLSLPYEPASEPPPAWKHWEHEQATSGQAAASQTPAGKTMPVQTVAGQHVSR